jgi:formylglycine-generating enzyme required for sulfatase activity
MKLFTWILILFTLAAVTDLGKADTPLPSNDAELTDYLKDTQWKFGEKILSLKSDGRASKSWGRLTPAWQVKELRLLCEGATFTFNPDFTRITHEDSGFHKVPGALISSPGKWLNTIPPVQTSAGPPPQVPAQRPPVTVIAKPLPTPVVATAVAAPPATGFGREEQQRHSDLSVPWENGLGMKFAPVEGLDGVLFAVWETRVRDFRAFVIDRENNRGYDYGEGEKTHGLEFDFLGQKNLGWDNPDFEQTDDHPVTCVSYEDAVAFCEWLTRVERAARKIRPNQVYRLPTDWEWSVAVGLKESRAGMPIEKDGKTPGYPWGPEWPPPPGWGNYCGEEVKNVDWPSKENGRVIEGWSDNHARTSKVGAYGAKHHDSLCDLGGNVWEWCEDFYRPRRSRVLRGGGWCSGSPSMLLSSRRDGVPPGYRGVFNGFRVVLAVLVPGYGEKKRQSVREMTVDLGGGEELELVWIEPGTFMMGNPEGERDLNNEEVPHQVTLTKGFWMGKYEVIQGQWERVMGSNPSRYKGILNPVEKVSWDDCQIFIEKLNRLVPGGGFRLPTEAEWEYACRAGTEGPYAGNLEEMAWCGDNCGPTTHPVGLKKPNGWELYDMHGNVGEWCEDKYGSYVIGPQTDPKGEASWSSRVGRGGGWNNVASSCRSAFRFRLHRSSRYSDIGFRLARTLP